jgi:dolichol-phosphate mannosyltransferase
LISQGGSFYARSVLRIPYRDCTAGFVGFKRRVLEAIDLEDVRSEGYAFQIELKYRAHQLGFSIVEVPIIFYDRITGTSKMSGSIVREAVWRVIQIRLRGG